MKDNNIDNYGKNININSKRSRRKQVLFGRKCRILFTLLTIENMPFTSPFDYFKQQEMKKETKSQRKR